MYGATVGSLELVPAGGSAVWTKTGQQSSDHGDWKTGGATVSGGATINDCLLQFTQDNLHFGGVGPSGMGSYHGHQSFLTFSHRKSVVLQSRVNALSLLNPPYGGLARWFTKLVTFL